MDIEQSLREGLAQRQEDKAAAFRKLRSEAPDVAAFVSELSAAFGKPSAVEIEYEDGTTFRSGEFLAAREHGDFWARYRATQTFFANEKFRKTKQRA